MEMEMTLALVTLVACALVVIFALLSSWRINYTAKKGIETLNAISRYNIEQIEESGSYSEDSYDDMLMDFDRHMFSVWKIGKYSRVNKEYVEILKPYFE